MSADTYKCVDMYSLADGSSFTFPDLKYSFNEMCTSGNYDSTLDKCVKAEKTVGGWPKHCTKDEDCKGDANTAAKCSCGFASISG